MYERNLMRLEKKSLQGSSIKEFNETWEEVSTVQKCRSLENHNIRNVEIQKRRNLENQNIRSLEK